MSRTFLLDTDFKSLGQHVWASYLIVFLKKINKAHMLIQYSKDQPCTPGDRDAR